jgi:hypothetical protein
VNAIARLREKRGWLSLRCCPARQPEEGKRMKLFLRAELKLHRNCAGFFLNRWKRMEKVPYREIKQMGDISSCVSFLLPHNAPHRFTLNILSSKIVGAE